MCQKVLFFFFWLFLILKNVLSLVEEQHPPFHLGPKTIFLCAVNQSRRKSAVAEKLWNTFTNLTAHTGHKENHCKLKNTSKQRNASSRTQQKESEL